MRSEEEALENVKNGKTWGYISFPKNYSEHLADRIVAGKFAENDTLAGSVVRLRLDMSRKS
jgi:hypothetical protein